MLKLSQLRVQTCSCLLLSFVLCNSISYQQDLTASLKADPIYLDLYHKLGSGQEFKLRGSILVKPKSEYRPARASFTQHNELSNSDLETLKKSTDQGDTYYLKTVSRRKDDQKPLKTTQTIVKSCSMYGSNLADIITINLSPTNDFISVNLITADQECQGDFPTELSNKFNTTLLVESGSIGPQPDTATYIKRLEEERQNKLKEGKQDNRSFFGKYWIYIVPAVIVLMMFSGPEQGAR